MKASFSPTTRELIEELQKLNTPDAPVRILDTRIHPHTNDPYLLEIASGFNTVDGRTTYLILKEMQP